MEKHCRVIQELIERYKTRLSEIENTLAWQPARKRRTKEALKLKGQVERLEDRIQARISRKSEDENLAEVLVYSNLTGKLQGPLDILRTAIENLQQWIVTHETEDGPGFFDFQEQEQAALERLKQEKKTGLSDQLLTDLYLHLKGRHLQSGKSPVDAVVYTQIQETLRREGINILQPSYSGDWKDSASRRRFDRLFENKGKKALVDQEVLKGPCLDTYF
jgi:DNA repair exonuclease SbcCD ATPase subunit